MREILGIPIWIKYNDTVQLIHPGQITNLGFTNYFFLLQNQKQKAAPNYLKMVSPLKACTPSIQMAVSQYQCCVT